MEDIFECRKVSNCAAERQYHMLFEAISEGVLIVGLSAHGKLKKLIEVNQNICQYTGFTKKELLDMELTDLFARNIPVAEIQSLGKFRTQNSYLFESFFNTKSGKKLPVEIKASAFEAEGEKAILMIARDISKRKNALDDLSLLEERFAGAFQLAPIMMVICSAKDRRFLFVNDCFIKSTGLKREDLLGKTADEFSLLYSLEERHKIIELLYGNEPFNNHEINLKNHQNEIVSYLVSAQKIKFSGQNAVLFVINDITERKLYQTELARLDRLNLVGEMAAEIGHEIRNPLTTVRGFLQMMRDDESIRQTLDYFDVMIEELDQANDIITDYLILAKDRRTDIKHANINQVIRCIMPLLEAEARRQGKEVEFNHGEIPLHPIDVNEIQQLIRNLVSNGLEAMPAGGKVTISTYQDIGSIVIAVQDQGRGIPIDYISKLGTPFFTTKENSIGLGLPVCYSIAARHRADINVSTSEEGTNIMVKFKTS